MSGIYYGRYADNVVPSATVSLTAGAANASFPLTNLYDGRPGKAFKATGTSCTIRLAFGGSTTIQAIAIINHNLPGATVTLTNGAGLNQGFTIPTDAEDGLSVDPFLDLRAVANNASTQWDLAISGAAANVAIGELVAVSTLRLLPVLWRLGQGEVMPAVQHQTSRGRTWAYPLGERLRRLECRMLDDTARSDLLSLKRGALGVGRGFLVIPELAVNDALFMRFPDTDLDWTRLLTGFSEQTFALEEVGRGLGV